MKKLVLLAALAFSANAMAQETLTDITPAAYDWANQPVGTKMVIKHYDKSWNTPFTFSYTLGGSEYLENGGCISANNTEDVEALMNGTAVVDLGEGIGKVMCINGAESKAQEVLGFTTEAALNSMMQINIFTNPDNTPRQQWIRCRIVLNIFTDTLSTTDGIIANMYFMDADNNNKHAGLSENKISSAMFAEYDEEGDPVLDDNEDYIYDKNRWMTFEIDFYMMDKFKGDTYEGRTSQDMPAKWKMYMPGAIKKATVFIKELKFFTLDGYTDDKDTANWPAYANAPHITFGPCPEAPSGISTTSTGLRSADNAIYNIAGQRVDQVGRGVYIVNGKKVVK